MKPLFDKKKARSISAGFVLHISAAKDIGHIGKEQHYSKVEAPAAGSSARAAAVLFGGGKGYPVGYAEDDKQKYAYRCEYYQHHIHRKGYIPEIVLQECGHK